jgi:hypothetical protein
MSRTIEAAIVIGMLLVLAALYHIGNTLERIETFLQERFGEPDDDEEDGP